MEHTENKAWAEFKTPLSNTELFKFCLKLETLFRINPYLEILKWEEIQTHKYYVDLVNHSQKPEFSLQTNLNVTKMKNGIRIQYENGIKYESIFLIEEVPKGSKLTITEKYHGLKAEEDLDQLNKVDKSLTKWAEAIQQYLIDWQKWSWFLPWKFYKQHVWLLMKPAARRISYMLIWISVIEIALILLGVAIYFLEFR